MTSTTRVPRPAGGRGATTRGTRPTRAAKATAASSVPERSGQVMLVAVVVLLCLIGLVMVLSASSVQALREDGSSWFYFRRQVMWVVGGTVALVLTARLDYRVLRRIGLPLLALSVALLVVVLLPGMGTKVAGSTRWIGVGGWRMQPSEVAKLGLLLFAADLLARRGGRPETARAAMRAVLLGFFVMAAMILLQPDLGTTLVLGCIVLCMLHVAGTPLRSVAGLLVCGAGAAFVLGMAEPYRRERLLSFLNPWADAGNTGYQVVQSLVGMGTGRFTGVGVGASRAKWGFLPNAHTDFIFSIIGEELGMVGSLIVLGLFAAFAVLGIRIALRAPDRYGMLLAAGITAWVISQAFINIGAVVGVVPVSGLPLPFVSFGGTSMVLLMGAVGVLLNIAGQGSPRPGGEAMPDDSARARSSAGRARRRPQPGR